VGVCFGKGHESTSPLKILPTLFPENYGRANAHDRGKGSQEDSDTQEDNETVHNSACGRGVKASGLSAARLGAQEVS
jgi:hypothetical protein